VESIIFDVQVFKSPILSFFTLIDAISINLFTQIMVLNGVPEKGYLTAQGEKRKLSRLIFKQND